MSGTQGRWLSPDPYMGSMDIANPQSMNRYAYVLNDPVGFVDPLGLDTCSAVVSDGKTEEVVESPCANVNTSPPGGINDTFLRGLGGVGDVGAFLIFRPNAGGGHATLTSVLNSIVSAVRTAGSYVPTVCGGGVFNYYGAHLSGAVAAVGVSKIQLADSRDGYSSGMMADIHGGEGPSGGYATIIAPNKPDEHLAFGGAGGDVILVSASVDGFVGGGGGNHFVGIGGELGTGVFQAGVGAYVNIDNATSCYDHRGR